MNSTKRYLPILAIGLVFVFSSTLTAANEQQGFASNLGLYNPCNNSLVLVKGPTKIDYHENSTGDGTHANVHFQIEANGQDASGNPYRTNLEGNGQFSAVAASYDLPFHSVWTGQQGAPSFTLNGTLRVFVSNGALAGAAVVGIDPPACTN